MIQCSEWAQVDGRLSFLIGKTRAVAPANASPLGEAVLNSKSLALGCK